MPLSNWLAVAFALALFPFLALLSGQLAERGPVSQFQSIAIANITSADLIKLQTPPSALDILSSPSTTATSASATISVSDDIPETAQLLTPSEPVPNLSTEEETAAAEKLSATIGLLRGAIVNFICIPSKRGLSAISGTGVIVDPRGIILTVAHVAQYFLLDDYTKNKVSCSIRTGSPAKNAYTGELIYLSATWIRDNKEMLSSGESRAGLGGQNDYAFIGITGRTNGTPAPSDFVSLPLAPVSRDINQHEPIAIGSYGAEFLDSSQIKSSLYQTILFGTIKELYTFTSRVLDLIVLQVGANAQEGASGGAVANGNNELIGLITTRTSRDDLSLRNLNAISMNHIRRGFLSETGLELDSYLTSKTISELVDAFDEEGERLKKLITEEL